MRIIDLGCGSNKYPGAIGVDIIPKSKADVVCDLNKVPWPFQDNVFDLVICRHLLEHLDSVIAAMEEIRRIAKDGAEVRITVPFMSSVDYWTDPTHKRAFTSYSFDYFIEGHPFTSLNYSRARYRLLEVRFQGKNRRWLDRLLVGLANRFKYQYQYRFAFIYPINLIHFRLKVIK